MEKKLWVVSLGGSRIVPKDVDWDFLKRFKEFVGRRKNHKFVVVTGGGVTARKYMSALEKLGKSTKKQSLGGIAITRLHASYLMRLIGKPANEVLPKNMKKVRNLLKGNQVVFCGGLRWKDKNTSDGTAASLAGFLK